MGIFHTLVLLAAALIPRPAASTERYDALINNPVFHADGVCYLDQYGWLDLIELDGSTDYRWQGWVLANRCLPPVRDHRGWVISFDDNGRRRVIVAPVYFRVESLVDLEVEDRKVWPESERRRGR